MSFISRIGSHCLSLTCEAFVPQSPPSRAFVTLRLVFQVISRCVSLSDSIVGLQSIPGDDCNDWQNLTEGGNRDRLFLLHALTRKQTYTSRLESRSRSREPGKRDTRISGSQSNSKRLTCGSTVGPIGHSISCRATNRPLLKSLIQDEEHEFFHRVHDLHLQ